MPIYMDLTPLSLKFRPTGAVVPVYVPEVKGFGDAPEPTQEDADAAAESLAAFYDGLPRGQQAVVEQILTQAADVSVASRS